MAENIRQYSLADKKITVAASNVGSGKTEFTIVADQSLDTVKDIQALSARKAFDNLVVELVQESKLYVGAEVLYKYRLLEVSK